jgi:hypothetical protein
MNALLRLFSALTAALAAVPSNVWAATDEIPPAFVLAIDATNSMNSKIKGVVKLDMAKTAFASAMSSAPGQAAAALLSFGDHPARACKDVTVQLPLTPAKKSANSIRKAFARLEPKISGKTPILAAAEQAARMIEAQGPGASGAMIVVTDGGDDCSPTACEAAGTFHTLHPNLPIHIVSLRPDRLTSAQLQCIAAETGGQFSEARTRRQSGQAVTAALQRPPEPLVAAPAPAAPSAASEAASQSRPSEPQPSNPQPTAAAIQLAPTNALQSDNSGPAPNVTLRASLAEGSAPLTQGVGWRIFPDASSRNKGRTKIRRNAGKAGKKPLWTGAGAEARIRLAPGAYYAEIAFGLVKTSYRITVPASGEVDEVAPLNAGVIHVRAVGRAGGAPLKRVFYRLFEDSPQADSGSPAEIGRSSHAQAVFYVPAGRYRVTAEYGLAAAATPVSVKPGASVSLDIPMNAGTLKLATKIRPDAPSPGAGAAAPSRRRFFYQVFTANAATPGARQEIARSSLDAPSFDLPQGAYRVAVRYDLAAAEKDVTVSAGEETRAVIGLSPGGLVLSSKIPGGPASEARSISHVIYRLPDAPGGEMKEIARTPNIPRAYQLNSGAYRVVSQYGPYNVRKSADVTIRPGETQKLEFELHPAQVSLSLKKSRGKRKIEWSVADASGREVARSEKAKPNLILKPGAYRAEARAGARTYSATFELSEDEKKAVTARAQ